MSSDKNLFGKVWDFFCSLKLTIFIFIFLAVTATIGTVIPQNAPSSEYLRVYKESTYRIIHSLGFVDLYHSWWFIFSLILLCLNVLACSIRNFPRTWKTISRTKLTLDEEEAKKAPFLETFKIRATPGQVREKILNILKKHFTFPKETVLQGSCHFFVEKGKYSRLGVYVTHASVLIILAGGLIGSLLGVRGFVAIPEGSAKDQIILPKGSKPYALGFTVRCDDFTATYYPNGAPKDYRSALTILEDNKVILSKTIEVNHPLTYKGIKFFQASFGTSFDQGGELTLLVKKKEGNDPGRQYRVDVGKSFALSQDGLTVTVKQFIPDFMLGENRTVYSRSTQPNNPAAELLISRGGTEFRKLWIFKNFPDFHGAKDLDYQFLLIGFKGKDYTGLDVVMDPGVWVVWTGCILMLLGTLVVFFLSHRKVWVQIRESGNKTEITLAGVANKNPLAFEKEFSELKKEIQGSF